MERSERRVHARKLKKPVRTRASVPPRSQRRLRAVQLGAYNATVTKMHLELQEMKDVLLGRTEPPVHHGLLTLMEIADAYFARASEMSMRLLQLEREGHVMRGSKPYKFRTGELRVFMEMAKRAADLGSRRITYASLTVEAERTGRSSMVDSMYLEDDEIDD